MGESLPDANCCVVVPLDGPLVFTAGALSLSMVLAPLARPPCGRRKTSCSTRNGIMMVSHYEHLQDVEGVSVEESIERGSMERLSPILMTALCAGLALIPLVIAGGQPGNEIQAPMGVVILGGLLSSTALNMLVVPALYLRFGSVRATAVD